MRLSVKASFAAVLLLTPLWFICSRPTAIEPELVPLPFKTQEESPQLPAMSLEHLEVKTAVLSVPAAPELLPPAVPAASNSEIQKMRKFSFNYGALEAEDKGAVRLKGAKLGVDFHVDEQQSVGVETSQQLYDRQDAKAWGESGKDESTAGIKYKLIF
jgi:hypothetical protein